MLIASGEDPAAGTRRCGRGEVGDRTATTNDAASDAPLLTPRELLIGHADMGARCSVSRYCDEGNLAPCLVLVLHQEWSGGDDSLPRGVSV